ncbi:MAG: gliding motility lipoprotein GldH [Paludibacter sp.]|nr:gliding motility lipoprotein GldH [Paludibacter sp.]
MPEKIKRNKIHFLLIAGIFFFVSCVNNDAYFQYQSVSPQGWCKDSVLIFDIPITDTISTYNLYVNIRNRGEYPYQNLWLFLQKMTPDSIITKDSIELYLADQRGKWLGSGLGSILEMPVLYNQNIQFLLKGNYEYKIQHGMRDSVLIGINDIGMRLEKVN